MSKIVGIGLGTTNWLYGRCRTAFALVWFVKVSGL